MIAVTVTRLPARRTIGRQTITYLPAQPAPRRRGRPVVVLLVVAVPLALFATVAALAAGGAERTFVLIILPAITAGAVVTVATVTAYARWALRREERAYAVEQVTR